MPPRAPALVPAALLVLALAAGCGQEVGKPGQSGSPSTPTQSRTAPPAKPTTPPSEAQEKVRVLGEVVEVGDCVVVRDDNAITWTITGEPSAHLELGSRVQVTGTPDLRAEGCGGPLVIARTVTVVRPAG